MLSSLFTLPITNPTLIVLIVMLIILFAPMLLNRLRIPHIVGLIIAGMAVGEYGLNILSRDASFEIFGKVGLLYIMFLAALEIDRTEFKNNKSKGFVFGILTFVVPMILGVASSYWLLDFNWVTSILLASMYASHTLIAYPIVSRMGVTKQRSVVISVAGTVITVVLALFILAVIAGMYRGTMDQWFFVRLIGLGSAAVGIIFYMFPLIIQWFFKKYSDNVLQFVFVLGLLFLSAFLFEVAGLEGILGAFLAGLVFNKYIPNISPLMNRIEFVGNALFIPYFLIGVGMLIDLGSLFQGGRAMMVAINMSIVATFSKWLAAFATQKIYRFAKEERWMLFGLSNAQAAATLAAVLIGYDLEIFDFDVLNGTIVMILVTCIISSLATEKATRALITKEGLEDKGSAPWLRQQRILISVSNKETVEGLVNFALLLRHPKRGEKMHALNVINDSSGSSTFINQAKGCLETAASIGAAVDVRIKMLSRYDVNVASGIIRTIKERNISELVMGIHHKQSFVDTFFGTITGAIIKEINRLIIICKFVIPVNTIHRIVVVIPPKAEYETGFSKWLIRIGRISERLSCPVEFYGVEATKHRLDAFIKKINSQAKYLYNVMDDWEEDFPSLTGKVKEDDLFVIITARPTSVSFNSTLDDIPRYLTKYFASVSWLVIYPDQFAGEQEVPSFSNPLLRQNKPSLGWMTGKIAVKK